MNYSYKIVFLYLSMVHSIRYFASKIFKHNSNIPLHNSKYNIVSITTNKIYNIETHKDEYIKQNDFIKDKKIISISPGGFKGVYMLGLCVYIKHNFNLDNFIFSGASAGAWNSLILCCKKDVNCFKTDIVDYSIKNSNTLFDLEYSMKNKILEYYTTDDFDLRRLYIGVTTLNGFHPETKIFSNFNNLEDAINCCIASSHIPLVTGGFINKYNNMFTFDGGFSRTPYLNISENVLHITPSIWNNKNIKPKKRYSALGNMNEFTTLFSKNKYNFTELYVNGYHDAKKNHDYLKSRLC